MYQAMGKPMSAVASVTAMAMPRVRSTMSRLAGTSRLTKLSVVNSATTDMLMSSNTKTLWLSSVSSEPRYTTPNHSSGGVSISSSVSVRRW
ncbi:hypothetical protein FQZ97_978570 [compost metagenome]